MAQIVLIANATFRQGINTLDDVVDIYDDDVELGGGGYDNFTIIQVPGINAEQVKNIIEKILPKEPSESKYPISFSQINTSSREILESTEVVNSVKLSILENQLLGK